MNDSRPVLLMANRSFDGVSDVLGGRTEVLVLDGVIREVGERVDRPEGADVIDLGDRTLSPGFIDCHTHSMMTPDRPLTTFHNESSAMKVLSALGPLGTLLHHGFTTIRDCASQDAEFGTVDLKRAVEKGLIEGPRMLVCPHMLSGTGGHGDFANLVDDSFARSFVCVADGPSEIRRMIRREARGGADWIKVAVTGGFFAPKEDPAHHVTYSQEELDVLVDTAGDLGLNVCVHSYGDAGMRRAVQAGARSIEHASLATEETLELAAERGTYVVPTMYMFKCMLDDLDHPEVAAAMPPLHRERLLAHRERMIATREALAPSGVRVAFGTDVGPWAHAEGWHEFQTLVDVGFTPAYALRAATGIASELLERPDLGRLRPDGVADIIAMPGDPLKDITVTGQVDFVMQGGHVVVDPRTT